MILTDKQLMDAIRLTSKEYKEQHCQLKFVGESGYSVTGHYKKYYVLENEVINGKINEVYYTRNKI